ncbi:MAG: hypothetical protein GY950_30075, partial [bacterium]|nr:hypothetical protein [bacterium]
SFVKGDSNIFYLKPSLPPLGITLAGILITLLYTAIAIFFTYRNAYRKTYEKTGEIENEHQFHAVMEKGEKHFLYTDNEDIKAKIYNHITGKENLKGELQINFSEEPGPKLHDLKIAYIPNAKHFDHISPNTMHRFLFGEKLTEPKNNWEILHDYAMTCDIVVFDDFLKNQPPDLRLNLLNGIDDNDLHCLIITSDYYMVKTFVKDRQFLHVLPGDPIGMELKNTLPEKSIEELLDTTSGCITPDEPLQETTRQDD